MKEFYCEVTPETVDEVCKEFERLGYRKILLFTDASIIRAYNDGQYIGYAECEDEWETITLPELRKLTPKDVQ